MPENLLMKEQQYLRTNTLEALWKAESSKKFIKEWKYAKKVIEYTNQKELWPN